MAENLLKALLLKYLTPEFVNDLMARIKSGLYGLIDAGIAALTAYFLGLLQMPSDNSWVVVGADGPTPVTLNPLLTIGLVFLSKFLRKLLTNVGTPVNPTPTPPPVRLAAAGLLIALAIGLSASVAYADPKAVIEAPANVSQGDLVVLDASKSAGSGYAWALTNSDKTYLPVDDGKRVVFASGATGEYVFVLAVAEGDKASLAKHKLQVGASPAPGPTPAPPSPTPGPTPPTPPSPVVLTGLAKFAFDACQPLPPAARIRSIVVAQALEVVASQISAGTLTSGSKIAAATKTALAAAYADQTAAWSPVDHAMNNELKRLAMAGKITSAAQLADAYREIANGLRAVN